MSAIARYYNFKGLKVSGYDKTPSELTHALESEGIEVHYEDNIDFIPKDVEDTLVVYTPAIPKDMGELVYVFSYGHCSIAFCQFRYILFHKSDLLRIFYQSACCLHKLFYGF